MLMNRVGVLRLTEETTKGTRIATATGDAIPLIIGGTLEPNPNRQSIDQVSDTAIVSEDLVTTSPSEFSAQSILHGETNRSGEAEVLFGGAGYSETTTLSGYEVDAIADFISDEVVSDGASFSAKIAHSKVFRDGASGSYTYWVYLYDETGTLADGETLTGTTSSASATVETGTTTAKRLFAESAIADQKTYTAEMSRDTTTFVSSGLMWNASFEATPKMGATPTLAGMGISFDPEAGALTKDTTMPAPSLMPRLCGAMCFYDDETMSVSSLSVDLGATIAIIENANGTNGECIDYAVATSFEPKFVINKQAETTAEITELQTWKAGTSGKNAQFQLGQDKENGFIFSFLDNQITANGRADTNGIDYRGLELSSRGGLSIIVLGA